MDAEERQKKVLAGKEKFAKLMKKKKTPPSHDVSKKKRKVEDEENSGSEDRDETRDMDIIRQDSFATSPVHTKGCESLSPGDVAGHVQGVFANVDLAEIQSAFNTEEDISEPGGKTSALFTRQEGDESSVVRKLQFDEKVDGECEPLPCSHHDIGLKLKEYHKKIQEFQSALRQRDDLIAQLSTSLQTTIAQRDVLQSEASLQSDALVLEIETLKLQLQQANEFLQNYKGKNGISIQELLDVKNELVALQLSYHHQQKQLDEACQELVRARAETMEHQHQKEITISDMRVLEEDQKKTTLYLREKDVENERLKAEIQRVSYENEKMASDAVALELRLVKLEEIHKDSIDSLQTQHLEEIRALKEEHQSFSLERQSLISVLDNELNEIAQENALEGTMLDRLEELVRRVHDSDLQKDVLKMELCNTKLLLTDTVQKAEAQEHRLQELETTVKSLEDSHIEGSAKDNLELVNQGKVIEDLKQEISDKDSRLAIYAEKLIELETHASTCEHHSKAEMQQLELQLARASDKIEELVQEARILSLKNADLEEELRKISHEETSGTFAAAVAELLDRCNMSDGSKLLALAKLTQDDTEGLQSFQASRDASIDWAECPSLPDSVGGDRIASGELDVDELWRVELEHLLADLEAVDNVLSSASDHSSDDDGPRARKDIANLKMKMRHLAGCFINVLREKSTLEALVRDLKKAIELQQMARNKVELNEQEEKLGKGDFALEHGPWEQEKQMLELCIADLNSKNESHIAARENLVLDMELLREECANLRQEKLRDSLQQEDVDNPRVGWMEDIVQRMSNLEKENSNCKDKLLTADENNAILKSQVNRLREALTVRDRQETQLRQELDCCYERQRRYWRERNVGEGSGDNQMISDVQQSLADLVDQAEKKAIHVSKGYTLGVDLGHETTDYTSKDLDSLSEYLIPFVDEDVDEDQKGDLTEKMVTDFVQRTVQQALEEVVVPENQNLRAKLAIAMQQHDEEMRKVKEEHAAQLEELTRKMDDLKATQLQELDQERVKIREEIINEYVNKFHVITQELETNHRVAIEELQKSVNHESCMKVEEFDTKVAQLVGVHQQEIITLEKEFHRKLEMVKAEMVQYHNSQMEAVVVGMNKAECDRDAAHHEELSRLKDTLLQDFEQERANLIGSHNSEMERLCQEHEDLDSANAHLRMLLTSIVRTYFTVAKNINKEFLSMLKNEAGSAGWDTTAGQSEFNDMSDVGEPCEINNAVDNDLREAVLNSIENGSELLDTSFLTIVGNDAASQCNNPNAEKIWFDPAHDEIVSEASSRLQLAVSQLLEMLSTTVQQLHEWRAGHSERDSGSRQSREQVEELEELRAQLKAEEDARNSLANELNKATALVKTCENQVSELHVELSKKEDLLQDAVEQMNKALARQEELEQNIAEDQRLLEKQQDIISEGLGEHEQLSAPRAETSRLTLAADDQGILDENMRLIKEKRGLQQQGEKARSGLLSRIHELEQTVEELSQRNEEIMEEKQRRTQDLKLQVEALDKQVKANRQFIEEQTVEREQEREDFQKGMQKMKDSIRDKERAIFSQADLSREVEALSDKLKDKAQKYHKLLERKEHLERDMKSLTETHHSQIDVIKELESQLDTKLHHENELIAKIDELQTLLKQSSRTEESLTHEIEELRAASISCASIGHMQFVNDLPKIHSPEMDDTHQINLMQELGIQLHVLEEKLEMRTRELEGLHVSATSSIGSPCSEEISVRDQISALRNANKEDNGQSFQLSDLRHLEDKADALSRAAEAATRKIRDQDSIIRKQRQLEEEWLQDKDALQHQLNAQLLQISSLQARLEEKRHGFMSANEMLEKISRLQLALQNEQEQSENRLSEVDSLNHQLEHVMQQLSMKERELSEYISRYNEHFGHRESEKISTKKEVDALNIKNKAMEDTILSLQKQVEDLSSLLQTLLKEKNEEIDGLNRQIQDFEASSSVLESGKLDNMELGRELSRLKHVLQESEEAVRTLSKDLEHRDVALKKLNEEMQEKLSTINVLSAQLQRSDSNLKEVKSRTDTEISSKDDTLKEQGVLLEAKNKELKRIQEIAEQRRREVESLKVVLSEKQQLLEQVKTLKDEVADLTDYQTRLQDDFDTVQGMLEDKHNELIAAHEELSEVLFSSEAIHQEKNRLTEELDSAQSQKLLLDKAISDRDKHINILNKRLDEISNEESKQQDKFRAEIVSLREQLETLESENAKEKREKCVDASDLIISSHADCQTDFPDQEDELKQQMDKIQTELQDNHQKREVLEAERLMRDSQIARLLDQLESTNQNNQQLQEELKSTKLDLEEKNTRINILEQQQDVREYDAAISVGDDINLLSAGPVSNLTPAELSSAADSESDSLSGESVPTRVKSLMRKVHKEGVQMLTLSEFHFLREHTPPKEDGEVQYTLSVEVGALKDVLQQLMNLLTALKDSSSHQSEWQQQLLQVISRILVREKQLIMAQLQLDTKVSSPDQIHLKTIEEKITAMDVHHQASLRDLARACQAYSVSTSSDTQMAIARERLLHQEEQRKLLQQLSNMEQQHGQYERQMKRRLEMLDFRLDQERLIAEDLRTTLDLEKSRAIELCSQLAQERSLNAQLEVTLCQIRSELGNLQSVLDTQCQELTSSRQAYECECTKNQMLQRALDAEKCNFTQLQEVMEAEKRRSRAAQGREQQIIEELRKALENEKDKMLNLTDALEREKLALQTVRKQQEKSCMQRSRANSEDKNINESDISWATDRTLVTLSEMTDSNLGVSSASELQQWLEIEQRKVRELMHRLEQERSRVATLTETLQQERLRLMEELDIQRSLMQQAKANLNVLQAQKGDLQKEVLKEREHVVLLEGDKERLLSMVGTLQEQVRQQEEQCESLRKMQRELHRDSELKQERHRHNQQDLEMQMHRVQQELQFVQRELDIAKKSEKQLKSDLENERLRVDTQGQDWNRIKEIKSIGDTESEAVSLRKQFADIETNRQKLQLLIMRAKDAFTAGWEMSALNSSLAAILQELMQMVTSAPLQTNKFVSDGFTVADLIEKMVQHNSELVAFIWNLNQEKQALHVAVSQAEEDLWKIRQKDPSSMQQVQQSSVERILAAERAAWAQERTRLQRALYKLEYELSGIKSRIPPSGYMAGTESPARAQMQFDDVQVNSMYFKYLRSQSFRKNLIHQKQYLLVRLKRLQVSEAHTLEVLDSLGCLPTTAQLQDRQQQQQPGNRFRSVARAAVAIARMRYLVKRWSRVHAPSAVSIYTSSENGIDTGSSLRSSRHQQRNMYQVTTPPVRDKDEIKPRTVPRSVRSTSEHSSSPSLQRALALQLESPAPSETSLSEFVQRFESLQQQLGIGQTARSPSHT